MIVNVRKDSLHKCLKEIELQIHQKRGVELLVLLIFQEWIHEQLRAVQDSF